MTTRQGFTLIELMIVVVIIAILAAIAIPNFVRLQSRANEASVKGNAHALQMAVEDYCVINDSDLPALADIDPVMFPGGVFPDNPFSGAVIAIAAPGYSQGDLRNSSDSRRSRESRAIPTNDRPKPTRLTPPACQCM